MKIKKVYIAAPLYSAKEQKDNLEIDEVLQGAGMRRFCLREMDLLMMISLRKYRM